MKKPISNDDVDKVYVRPPNAELPPWCLDVLRHFPDWSSESEALRWRTERPHLRIGDGVVGTVVAVAPDRLFVDISVGFPATLLLTEVVESSKPSDRVYDLLQLGSMVSAQVAGFHEDWPGFRLSQRPPIPPKPVVVRPPLNFPMWSAYLLAPLFLVAISCKTVYLSESPAPLVGILATCGVVCAAVLHAYQLLSSRIKG